MLHLWEHCPIRLPRGSLRSPWRHPGLENSGLRGCLVPPCELAEGLGLFRAPQVQQ